MPTAPPLNPARFWPKVDASGDCWLWTGQRFTNGYGLLRTDGTVSRRALLAHRIAWRLLIGPLDQDITLDHRCRVRTCVNPDHLEPVTRAVNTLRSESPAAVNARKTHCKNGHPLTADNLYVARSRSGNPSRVCRACRLAWMAARKDIAS